VEFDQEVEAALRHSIGLLMMIVREPVVGSIGNEWVAGKGVWVLTGWVIFSTVE